MWPSLFRCCCGTIRQPSNAFVLPAEKTCATLAEKTPSRDIHAECGWQLECAHLSLAKRTAEKTHRLRRTRSAKRGCHYALRDGIPGVSLIGGQHPEEKETFCESTAKEKQPHGEWCLDLCAGLTTRNIKRLIAQSPCSTSATM